MPDITLFKASSCNKTVEQLLHDNDTLNKIGIDDIQLLHMVIKVISLVRQHANTMPPHRLLELLLVESGFVKHVLRTDPEESAGNSTFV